MSKDEIIARLRAALKPLADEPLKEEDSLGNPMMCDLTDAGMNAIILAAREAIALKSDEEPSIH